MAAEPQDRVVVVTGGSSGIGRALGRAFGATGATVWLGARTVDALREAAREVDDAGGHGHFAKLDVTSEASVERFAQRVAKEARGIDVLVNNAGVGAWAKAEETSVETWRNVIDTNLTGPFLVTKAFLPLLRQKKGRRHLLNVVSVAGKQAYAGGGTYAASKFGLRGWTEALALELAEEGIRVTAILPGYVDTPLVKGAASAKRMIDPDDLAQEVVRLTHAPESVHVDELTVWPWRMYTD